MKRPHFTWLIFFTCLFAATAAVGWLSVQTLQAERAERLARQQADLENRVRVALWRMDSIAVPIVAIESTRPSLTQFTESSKPLASNLLKGYFQQNARGPWTIHRDGDAKPEPLTASSPLVAVKDWRNELPKPDRAAATQTAPSSSNVAQAGRLPGQQIAQNFVASSNTKDAESNINLGSQQSDRQMASQQAATANRFEAQSRNQLKQQVFDFANLGQMSQAFSNASPPVTPSREPIAPMTGGALGPLWIQGELVLARRVLDDRGEEFVEGCWLNWPAWREMLLAEVVDILPSAQLVAVRSGQASEGGRELVSLPVRLDPGVILGASTDSGIAALGWPTSLVAAWATLTVAGAATAWLLMQTLQLSERRAAFVSAVTHELRTPLTTFRLYTEMLTDGIVTDPEQQQTYFQTLHREANRLMHMVENVLAYARLEKGRTTQRSERLSVGDLLDRSWPRLTQRVTETRMQLELVTTDSGRARLLTTNALAVEQILFNLVDNACKYAIDALDPRIVIEVEVGPNEVALRVRDFGPGLSHVARQQLFEPFGKSSAQAAESAPGIGLGLSLARRLARDLGGELRFDGREKIGLAFILTLPCATAVTE